MEFIYSDGGRSNYFKAKGVGDCVTRAICNATGKDYKEVYDALKELASHERTGCRKKEKSSVRDGVYKNTVKKYIEGVLGWKWIPTMKVGVGCMAHLNRDELPSDQTIIVKISKHLTCIKNGVIYDTYNCSEMDVYDENGFLESRSDDRAVYGYWVAPTEDELKMFKQGKKEIAQAKEKEYIIKEQKKQIRYQYHLKISKLEREIAKLKKLRDNELNKLLVAY